MDSEISIYRGGGGGGGGTVIVDNDDDKAPLWKYVTKLERFSGGGNLTWECNYCHKVFKSSHTRVKAHLLHIGGGTKPCKAVTQEDIAEMWRLVEEAELRGRGRIRRAKGIDASPMSVTVASVSKGGFETKKRRGADGSNGSESAAFSREAQDQLDVFIARMFYSAGLPFQLAKNPFFVRSLEFAANNMIPGYLPPGYDQLSTSLLESEKSRIEDLSEPVRAMWKKKGVSIVADGWSDPKRKPVINVIAVSDGEPMFLNAVDTEGEAKDESYIADVLIKAIQEVGNRNVVQVVTDLTPKCRAAGLLVEKTYPHIFWTPCMVHSLDVALKNIFAAKNTKENGIVYDDDCRWISDISREVVVIRNFIIKHPMKFPMLNHHEELKLLDIPKTRFAFDIIILRKFKVIKRSLQDMVVSERWNLYKEKDEGKAEFVKQKVLDDIWWEKVDYIVSFTEPIYDMLRFANTDKPNLHLVYDMWGTMIEKVMSTIYRHGGKRDDEESSFYSMVHSILVEQWKESCTPLHCLAYSLNPKYYSTHWLIGGTKRVAPHMDVDISKERATCLKRYFPNADKRRSANMEYAKFSAGLDAFADDDSLNDRGLMDPKTWWVVYGAFAPLLQGLALKLLGQPCSSSGCERNWSTYSFVHSIKRNNMNPQQAEDLVNVHTNLRLLSRKSPEYYEGETKMWDIAGDDFGSLEGSGILEVAKLSLDEPELESMVFGGEDKNDNAEAKMMNWSSNPSYGGAAVSIQKLLKAGGVCFQELLMLFEKHINSKPSLWLLNSSTRKPSSQYE
ncbi:uncharacterized protein M6B38_158170 [Iris pallida]|uniref:BED-type domain-containing protein n=1 Tax=Iris pallida TaxID=29817 RepID=A0AAX6F191_IRIPA|nr:uncharacterized protein M6B38_158170 [Iris pallida]